MSKRCAPWPGAMIRHDNSWKTLKTQTRQIVQCCMHQRLVNTNLWIVFGITSMGCNGLQIEATAKFTIATIFWRVGMMPSTAVICWVRGAGLDGTEVEGEDGPAMALKVVGGDKGLFCVCGWVDELDRGYGPRNQMLTHPYKNFSLQGRANTAITHWVVTIWSNIEQ